MTLDADRKREFRQRLRETKSLPTLPPIAAKLNAMVEDEEVTAAQIGSVIEKDQVLTSKLLKMVNSSFIGFPQRIGTVSNAIVLLGFDVIKTLVVTSSIFDAMQESDIGLWEHSLGVATASGILARRRAVKKPEEISTAGLIHDLGKIVIRAELPHEYRLLEAMASEQGISLREAELEFLGVGHAEIGGMLVKQWLLPERLIQSVSFHHAPEYSPDCPELAAIIHFSDILIRAVGFGSGGDPWVPPLDHGAWERVKMGRRELREVLAELDDLLVELQDFTLEIRKISGA